ncbi:hypothetical protein BGW42_002983 [Actinomortierella wolfii]|nr:hypothetical protein BGW42_002983 [Actinomortierella wolfii]
MVQSVTETALTRTIRYVNGKVSKTYKPQFWNQPALAKQELGSFLETLSKRSQAAVETRVVAALATASAAGADEGDIDSMQFFSYFDNSEEPLRQERYLGFLPMGGSNNQFVNVQKAALMAKRTGRTLVLPPISPSTHVRTWDGRPYSEFYDIPGFIRNSGIKVVEWHEIKTVPSDGIDGFKLPKQYKDHWIDFAEEFPCQVTANIGKNNSNLYDRFRNQYLLKFVASNVPEDETHGNVTEFAYAENVLLRNNRQATSLNSPKIPRDLLDPLPHDELWQCLSCPYFLTMDRETGPMLWNDVGMHLRFNRRLEAMADLLLRHILLGEPLDRQQLTSPLLGTSASLPPEHPALPEFIIIHLRRGDIVSKCHGVAEEKCLVQIEAIAEQVARFEEQRKREWREEELGPYKPLPVLVATNEQRASELDKLDKLGWIRIDHGDVSEPGSSSIEDATNPATKSKAIRLGTESLLGPFYPPMLDGILLTRGKYFIGMVKSKMSQLAATRGHEWYGHTTVLMEGSGV